MSELDWRQEWEAGINRCQAYSGYETLGHRVALKWPILLAANKVLQVAEAEIARLHQCLAEQERHTTSAREEIAWLRNQQADLEQQASNAITWQAAMVRVENEAKRLTADLAANAKLLARQCDLAREAETEVKRLRAALAEVKAEAGAVCPDFELCDHAACRASYAAWHIADVALKG